MSSPARLRKLSLRLSDAEWAKLQRHAKAVGEPALTVLVRRYALALVTFHADLQKNPAEAAKQLLDAAKKDG